MQALIPETGGIAQLITNAITIFVVIHVILGACAYAIMLERKLSAWMQDRIGPNRVGPQGLLQPIADGLKFIMKEEFTPRGVDKALFMLAPTLIMMPAMISFANPTIANASCKTELGDEKTSTMHASFASACVGWRYPACREVDAQRRMPGEGCQASRREALMLRRRWPILQWR